MSSLIQPTVGNPDAAVAQSRAIPASANILYRAVWRWHFYAGLFVVPFLMVLAITGSIYLFKPQLDRLMYPQTVQPAGALQPPTAQLAAVQAVYPGAAVSAYLPPPAADRSAEVMVTHAERDLTVFVNPYSATVLGERNETNNLQYYAKTIHGDLMIGTLGDRLIELAACWTIVMVLTGLFLWWPRKGSRVWGVMLPRFQLRNRRLFWRDLHAVPGFWGALLVLFMVVTGLPWTGFWGDQFTKSSSSYPAQIWNDVPMSTRRTGTLNQSGSVIVPWATEQMPMPESDPNHGSHAGHGGRTSAAAPAVEAVSLDRIVAIADELGVVPGYTISLPSDETGVYTVSAFPDDPTQEATLHIDQYSGAVLADVRWQHYGVVPKAVEMGISLHEGRYFGLANQVLMFGICLLIILLCATGIIMWWRRRPATFSLGAPAMPANVPRWKSAVALMTVLGVLLPLMGLSLLIVLLIDVLVIQCIPRIRRLFA